KLSRPEVIAISRTADAIVAILTVLGGVDLLRDVSAMRRTRVSALLLLLVHTVRRVDGRRLPLLLLVAIAVARAIWGRVLWPLLADGATAEGGRIWGGPKEMARRVGRLLSHTHRCLG